jgi:hypothetical protein
MNFFGNYTFAKSISNAQGTDAPTAFAGEEPYAVEIANRYNLRYDRGNVVGTPRGRFLFTGSYELPYGAGRHWNGNSLMNGVPGGWNLSTVTLLQSGQWLTPTMNPSLDQSNTDLNNLRYQGGAVARPDCTANAIPSNQSPSAFFDINAFAAPPANAGRFGTCLLGILQGPGGPRRNQRQRRPRQTDFLQRALQGALRSDYHQSPQPLELRSAVAQHLEPEHVWRVDVGSSSGTWREPHRPAGFAFRFLISYRKAGEFTFGHGRRARAAHGLSEFRT